MARVAWLPNDPSTLCRLSSIDQERQGGAQLGDGEETEVYQRDTPLLCVPLKDRPWLLPPILRTDHSPVLCQDRTRYSI